MERGWWMEYGCGYKLKQLMKEYKFSGWSIKFIVLGGELWGFVEWVYFSMLF